jgi:hypothetical protein
MNTQEKLEKLLKVAIQNEWYNVKLYNKIMLGTYDLYPNECHYFNFADGTISINDVVLNFNGGGISFIEALCIGAQPIAEMLYFEKRDFENLEHKLIYRLDHFELCKIWISLPTSKRLSWLLSTFELLL